MRKHKTQKVFLVLDKDVQDFTQGNKSSQAGFIPPLLPSCGGWREEGDAGAAWGCSQPPEEPQHLQNPPPRKPGEHWCAPQHEPGSAGCGRDCQGSTRINSSYPGILTICLEMNGPGHREDQVIPSVRAQMELVAWLVTGPEMAPDSAGGGPSPGSAVGALTVLGCSSHTPGTHWQQDPTTPSPTRSTFSTALGCFKSIPKARRCLAG